MCYINNKIDITPSTIVAGIFVSRKVMAFNIAPAPLGTASPNIDSYTKFVGNCLDVGDIL